MITSEHPVWGASECWWAFKYMVSSRPHKSSLRQWRNTVACPQSPHVSTTQSSEMWQDNNVTTHVRHGQPETLDKWAWCIMKRFQRRHFLQQREVVSFYFCRVISRRWSLVNRLNQVHFKCFKVPPKLFVVVSPNECLCLLCMDPFCFDLLACLDRMHFVGLWVGCYCLPVYLGMDGGLHHITGLCLPEFVLRHNRLSTPFALSSLL